MILTYILLLLLVFADSVFGLSEWENGVMFAIRDGKSSKLQALFDEVGDKEELSKKLSKEFCGDVTPLQFASKTNGATISILLEAGVNPSVAHRSTKTTPLMFAARSGERETVTKLLSVLSKEEVNARDEHESTALALTSIGCHLDIAKQLIAAGATVFTVDNNGNTPAHVGAYYCKKHQSGAYAEALISTPESADVSNLDRMSTVGRTALMLAAKKGNVDFFDVFVKAGANEHIISPDNKSIEDFKAESIKNEL